MLSISVDDLVDPAVVALLESHVAELRSISPPESTHALDLAGLRAPGVTSWVARDSGSVVGCVALAPLPILGPGHAELKSMRTATLARGRGVGSAMLRHVLAHARHGFVDCGPFGSYRPDPLSTFMTLPLAPTTTPSASSPENS